MLQQLFDGVPELAGSSSLSDADYITKVEGYSPSWYWPLDDASGAVIDERIVGATLDGAYNGVTLNAGTFVNGSTAHLWDGVNDNGDIYTAALNTAYTNGDELSVLMWIKAASASFWDTSQDTALLFGQNNTNNHYWMYASTTANQFVGRREANSSITEITWDSGGSTDWFCVLMTASVIANEFKVYVDGDLKGTDTAAAMTSHTMDSARQVIGDRSSAAAQQPANIYARHLAIFQGTVLDQTAATDLAVAV